MKKFSSIILLLMSSFVYSQTIKLPLSIDEYLSKKGMQNIIIIENNHTIIIQDNQEIQSSSQMIERINKVFIMLNKFSNEELKSNVVFIVKEIKYQNKNVCFDVDQEWIDKYFNNANILQKSNMISDLTITSVEKYRLLNKSAYL